MSTRRHKRIGRRLRIAERAAARQHPHALEGEIIFDRTIAQLVERAGSHESRSRGLPNHVDRARIRACVQRGAHAVDGRVLGGLQQLLGGCRNDG